VPNCSTVSALALTTQHRHIATARATAKSLAIFFMIFLLQKDRYISKPEGI
jgi:hypothetical protein